VTRLRPRAQRAADSVVYAYAVARLSPPRHTDAAARLPGILPRVLVHAVTQGDLTLFAGAVPADEFGAPALRAAIADPQWLSDRVLAHQAAVDALWAVHPLLPFRFATVFRDCAEAACAVAEHRGAWIFDT
jgi:hypothetical protein